MVLKSMTDQETSPHVRQVLSGFVNTNAEWAKRGILTERWFENTVDMLTSLKVSINPEDLTAIYGLDLEAERGSSPETLSSPEVLREAILEPESEIVLVLGDEPEQMRDLGDDEVFDDEISTPPLP